MRVLIIHAEYFKYEVREKAIDSAEITPTKGGEFNNVLVVFTTVEEGDGRVVNNLSAKVVSDISDIYSKVKASAIVLYPYAHLSSRLAGPDEAMNVLKHLEEVFTAQGIKTYRAPFGWYKAFDIRCYGHPLSELSREYKVEEGVRQVTITRKYLIITPDGGIYSPEEYTYKPGEEDLKILVEKEVFKKELPGGKSRLLEVCRKFGFEWEPMSDSGHMRYEPHATVMVEAVRQYSWMVAKSLGIPVLRVMGTNMFNLKFKPIKEHADLFGDRLYEVESEGSKLVMRYAACHQQFAMIRDWVISYKELPLGVFEVADSYRFEQKGELVLCFRLRKFYMPDLHILLRDLDEGKKFSFKVQDKIVDEIRKLGREYVAIYNVTEDFFESNKDYVIELIRRMGRPALVTLYPPGVYYWVINVEYNVIDELKRPREVATFQIDVGNSARFNIRYVDESGAERYPVIIHTAIIGSIERYIYIVLDKAVQDEESGKIPNIPTWLAPIQVRIIPLSSEFMDFANEVLDTLLKNGIRVDVDDRDLTLAKKIREAGIEWIPYVVVIGGREFKTRTLNVRIRASNIQKTMSLNELVEVINKDLEGYPKVDSTLPPYLTLRPALHYLKELS
ncbi:MAG: threonine--tRNA ligase [Sulfolobales archaeon]